MEPDAKAGVLEALKPRVPDDDRPVAELRKEYSAFYRKCQQGAGEPPFLERVAIGDTKCFGYWVSLPESRPDRIVLFFHGGGFSMGSTADHTGLILRLAKASESRVFSPDYRLAPEYPFPAAAGDAVSAYRYLITRGYSSHHIVPGGSRPEETWSSPSSSLYGSRVSRPLLRLSACPR